MIFYFNLNYWLYLSGSQSCVAVPMQRAMETLRRMHQYEYQLNQINNEFALI
jgi:hypothetical protein